MSKNGFTLIEMLVMIMIIGVISTIAIVSISSFVGKARIDTYETLEKNYKEAATSYLIDNDNLIPTSSAPITISINTLMSNMYIKSFDDKCNSSDSYVTVTRDTSNTINVELNYEVCLICEGYTSGGCL